MFKLFNIIFFYEIPSLSENIYYFLNNIKKTVDMTGKYYSNCSVEDVCGYIAHAVWPLWSKRWHLAATVEHSRQSGHN